MSLRTRLLLAVGGLLAVALVVVGIIVVGITRNSLVDRLDNELRGFRPEDFAQGAGPGRPDTDPTGRRMALVVLDTDGNVLEHLASGFATAPDPLPALSRPDTSELPLRQIVEATSDDGSLRYRVLTFAARGGVFVAVAAPMREVDQAVFVVIRALVVVGGMVLVLALLAGWLLIRRDLRPLEEVTATATRISAGDLSQRVGIDEPGTEVGRLGHAFDSMLDQIQGAFGEQQRALTAKERSEGKLRQFVADASHELRTPLTTLRGYSDLYRAGGLAEAGEMEQAMMRIGTESRRMAELVEDMLLLARLDQGRPLERGPVSMSEIVDDAVSDARAVEPQRPIRATVAPDLTVLGDEGRLRQVVGNLFANFRVHAPPDTTVEVSLAAADGRCTLVVADHGAGVDAQHVGHIFDRFYRADAARSRDRGGSGLGLAIAASVVEAHGGAIAYTTTAGGGATFTVELPRATDAAK